MLDKVFTRRRN